MPFRGVQRAAFAIRDEARLIEGRRFAPGVREVIVGRKAAKQFEGLAVGSRIAFRDSDWTVVGIFESDGDVHESEIWADAEVAMSAFRRTGYQSVTARLADGSEAGLAAFRDSISRDRALLDHRAARARVLREAGDGAVPADQRARLHGGELHGGRRHVRRAQLHVLGHREPPGRDRHAPRHRLRRDARRDLRDDRGACCSRCVGGAIGGTLAYLYCDGASLSTLNFNTFSQVAFDFRVTPGLLMRGLVWAIVIGLAGGLLPAIRAARIPVTEALRTL